MEGNRFLALFDNTSNPPAVSQRDPIQNDSKKPDEKVSKPPSPKELGIQLLGVIFEQFEVAGDGIRVVIGDHIRSTLKRCFNLKSMEINVNQGKAIANVIKQKFPNAVKTRIRIRKKDHEEIIAICPILEAPDMKDQESLGSPKSAGYWRPTAYGLKARALAKERLSDGIKDWHSNWCTHYQILSPFALNEQQMQTRLAVDDVVKILLLFVSEADILSPRFFKAPRSVPNRSPKMKVKLVIDRKRGAPAVKSSRRVRARLDQEVESLGKILLESGAEEGTVGIFKRKFVGKSLFLGLLESEFIEMGIESGLERARLMDIQRSLHT